MFQAIDPVIILTASLEQLTATDSWTNVQIGKAAALLRAKLDQ